MLLLKFALFACWWLVVCTGYGQSGAT